ncbi:MULTISPECIES: C-3',4' desaturase CrtD [unclassified Synechocystis]|uniref:C-3',4' desaturase CrtD n=1 Tax=unclassified Synechocystis TaxID=2640012 RepID=UPI000402755A|nr:MULTISPECIES: C-3',4' desaturase CrtD [unclassified Synechocystis]AIE75949.1 Neurosporene desaturase [Synechocystis sp. PCC 6714]MCT0255135.1 C-3',4' desaturase CrtD [Synechocystis sp. CS-94]
MPCKNAESKSVVVVGAGIGGLTTAALLAQQGYQVKVYEQAAMAGGCASTFRRRGFIFDVGATQVAGLEPGGIHHRILRQLQVNLPEATLCDPACAVFLPGEKQPINVWHDPERWQRERERQFPGSEAFWQLLQTLFQISWRFQGRDPVLPPRSIWDLGQLLGAVRPDTLLTAPFVPLTVGDTLQLLGLGSDQRLKTFLDLQLKLYSQVGADETALLYAATALGVSQAPQGLWHLQGSMQTLGDRLLEGLKNHGGKLFYRQRVEQIHAVQGQVEGITVRDLKTGAIRRESAQHVVANLTVQDLLKTVDQPLPGYQKRVTNLPPSSGAFVIYLGVREDAIPPDCAPHLQFLYDGRGPIGENNSLFVSVSKPGDGRAPDGYRTLIASSFTDVTPWWNTSPEQYQALKESYTKTAIAKLGKYFNLNESTIVHQESATPRTFARYTARDQGIVGGVGQRLTTFGPFGFAPRTPIHNLWLVGDSVHPGEGTAGVSYSALTIARQICVSGATNF